MELNTLKPAAGAKQRMSVLEMGAVGARPKRRGRQSARPSPSATGQEFQGANPMFTPPASGVVAPVEFEGANPMVSGYAGYAGRGRDVPKKANVDYMDPYKPLFYGFGSFRRGINPSDHALGKVLPGGKKK